jgi:uncharacterized protein (DUF4415 family)
VGTDEHIVRHTAEELSEKRRREETRSDWARVDAMTEEELEASIDVEEEGEIDWDHVQVTVPPGKQQLTIRIDADVLDWFRGQGPGYQTRINQVLRAYVDARRTQDAKGRRAS